MDKKHSLPNSSHFSNDDNNITSKLRRLRIQEALLLQSVQKSVGNIKLAVELCNSSISYRDLLKKVKESYINIKNLYDEVKTNTQSQELFVDIDIDEIKKKIFELETNIKTFKSEINSELAILKLSEQDINKKIIENPNEIENSKRRPKTLSVNYNAVVTSPVRAQMTSPLKCSEVQQFQEFMKNSPNRYGGWNEYNHNLFVKYWQKSLGKNYIAEFEDENFKQSIAYKTFMEEVLPKLQGVTVNAFTAHVSWYVKYLFHKAQQQNAIDKWKWNKMTSRKVLKTVMNANEENNFVLGTSTATHHFIASNFNACQSLLEKRNKNMVESKSLETKRKSSNKRPDRTFSLLKPTKQWLCRYQHNDDDNSVGSPGLNSVETMEKQLRTPYWRLGL